MTSRRRFINRTVLTDSIRYEHPEWSTVTLEAAVSTWMAAQDTFRREDRNSDRRFYRKIDPKGDHDDILPPHRHRRQQERKVLY